MELAAEPDEAAESDAVVLGELRLDPRREAAFYADRALALTGGEFELLLLLASRFGGFVHRQTIMRTLGRAGSPGGEPRRSADMHVCESGASSAKPGRHRWRSKRSTATAMRCACAATTPGLQAYQSGR